MTGTAPTPHPSHDTGYKWLFSHPRVVEDLMRGFVGEDWVAERDFTPWRKSVAAMSATTCATARTTSSGAYVTRAPGSRSICCWNSRAPSIPGWPCASWSTPDCSTRTSSGAAKSRPATSFRPSSRRCSTTAANAGPPCATLPNALNNRPAASAPQPVPLPPGRKRHRARTDRRRQHRRQHHPPGNQSTARRHPPRSLLARRTPPAPRVRQSQARFRGLDQPHRLLTAPAQPHHPGSQRTTGDRRHARRTSRRMDRTMETRRPDKGMQLSRLAGGTVLADDQHASTSPLLNTP